MRQISSFVIGVSLIFSFSVHADEVSAVQELRSSLLKTSEMSAAPEGNEVITQLREKMEELSRSDVIVKTLLEVVETPRVREALLAVQEKLNNRPKTSPTDAMWASIYLVKAAKVAEAAAEKLNDVEGDSSSTCAAQVVSGPH